jgi:D-glycero-D-manno-heptose 1,7-bisphosphate phosphatase
MKSRLIILDRDGVINVDSPYFIKSTAEWIPIKGSIEAISMLKKNNFVVSIATNQSGLSRGLFDESELSRMHKKMSNLLLPFAASIDLIKFCPHLPEHNCSCRKPLPGMYKEISNYFSIPLEGVPVVGDSLRDLQAAVSVNADPYLVLTGKGQQTVLHPDLPKETKIFDDLASVTDFLINHG